MKNKEENFHGEEGRQFYLGNKNLPRSGAEFEWTPEMVATLKKCKRNILHFAENYFYIVNLDRGKEKIALYMMTYYSTRIHFISLAYLTASFHSFSLWNIVNSLCARV